MKIKYARAIRFGIAGLFGGMALIMCVYKEWLMGLFLIICSIIMVIFGGLGVKSDEGVQQNAKKIHDK